jgi:hypothetical protein
MPQDFDERRFRSTAMRLTYLGHACLLVETDGARARRPRTPQEEEETDVDERHG